MICFECNKFAPPQRLVCGGARLFSRIGPNLNRGRIPRVRRDYYGRWVVRRLNLAWGQMKGRHGGGPVSKKLSLGLAPLSRAWYKFYTVGPLKLDPFFQVTLGKYKGGTYLERA